MRGAHPSAPLSMQRRNRLVGGRQFQDVRRHGQSWSHPLLVLLAQRNELSYNRFGFVVGKRIGGAVVRNRVKRRLREAMRARCGDMVLGWDMVLIARMPIVKSDFVHIIEAVDSLLCRAGLTTAPSKPPDAVE